MPWSLFSSSEKSITSNIALEHVLLKQLQTKFFFYVKLLYVGYANLCTLEGNLVLQFCKNTTNLFFKEVIIDMFMDIGPTAP